MPTARKPKSPTAQSAAALLAAYLSANRARFGTDAAFASEIQCTGARLSQLLHGDQSPVRPHLAIAIHRITGGAVPGNVLRPDLWRRAADVPIEGNQ